MANLTGATGPKTSPFQRFLRLVVEDRRELFGISIYALLNSLLLLAIPLAAQGLVNVAAAGLAVQPLLVLVAALLSGLLFAGLLTCLRFLLAELIQERIFCRIALRVAEQLPKVKSRYLAQSGGPELMNRFFDVINIQKSWFKLVFDGPGAVLEILIGLSLLALYGIELFAGATAFVVGGGLIIAFAGWGGVKSSINESAEKYRVAEWLEEMVRCQSSLRLNSREAFWTEQADDRVVAWLNQRRKHFRVLMRQVMLHYLVSAVSMAGMLGFGGYLVLKGQLSLGQLVAAELVVWSLFKATEKLLRSCEAYFDLLTGLDKIGYITDLPVDNMGVGLLGPTGAAANVCVERAAYSYGGEAGACLRELTFSLKPGETVALLGPTGVGKSTLLRMLAGYLNPQSGSVEMDMVDLRELSSECKAQHVAYLPDRNELFAGSVMDNVAIGRQCDLHRVRELLLETGGREALRRSACGGLESLTSAGSTISAGEQTSILLSRALLGGPRLLLLDDSLCQLSEQSLEQVLNKVFRAPERPTVVCTSTLPQVVRACDRVLLLEDGKLVEDGPPSELAHNSNSRFTALYPSLSRAILATPPRTEDSNRA
jgi:ATP-binding cassette subfamily B protein